MQENNFKVNPHSLKTAISRVETDRIITRGYNQRDLIEKIRYSDMVFLLLKGRLPSLIEGKIFNHVLVSFCDHGATPPSTQTARLIASSGSPINSAVAGALLSFGHKHAGAIEKTMELYQSKISTARLIDDPDIDNKQIASLAIEVYKDYVLKGKKVPGLLCMHIAPYEYRIAQANPEICVKEGSYDEGLDRTPFNSGLFSLLLQRGDVKAISSGHTHMNDFDAEYCGIRLLWDACVGYRCYGVDTRRGGRLFIYHEDNPSRVDTKMIRTIDKI